MKRKTFFVVFLCLVCLIWSSFESEGKKPPSSNVRITGEFLAGVAGGVFVDHAS